MKHYALWILTMAGLISVGSAVPVGVARAQEGTHARAGIGFAATAYRTTDDLRNAQNRPLTDSQGQPIPDQGTIDLNRGNWHAFLDWYVRPSFGLGLQYQRAFGVRTLNLNSNQTATLFGQPYQGVTYQEQPELTTLFLTANWLPIRGNVADMGLTAGVGRAVYAYRQFIGQDSDMDSGCWFGMGCGGMSGGHGNFSNQYSNTSSVESAAGLVGIFFDWARIVGVRLGVNYVYMPISTLRAPQPVGSAKNFSVDGSGWTLYLDATIGS